MQNNTGSPFKNVLRSADLGYPPTTCEGAKKGLIVRPLQIHKFNIVKTELTTFQGSASKSVPAPGSAWC